MRRDFRQLLTTIQAIALLYQQQRQQTADGAVIALVDDYAIARDLLSSIFETIVTEGLTPAVRATVEAVKPEETIGVSDLAQRLGLSKSTVGASNERLMADGSRTPRTGKGTRRGCGGLDSCPRRRARYLIPM